MSSTHGSAMVGLRSEAAQRRGRDALVDRARDALARVDVPARRAFEPAAAGELEAPAVARRSNVTLATIVSAPTISRSKRGRSGSSTKRSCISAGSSSTRRSRAAARARRRLRRGRRRRDDADCRSRSARARAAPRGRRVGEQRLPAERDARQERNAVVDVEHGDGESALPHVHAELEPQRAHGAFRREPGADAGRARARVRRGRRVVSLAARRICCGCTRRLRSRRRLALLPSPSCCACTWLCWC